MDSEISESSPVSCGLPPKLLARGPPRQATPGAVYAPRTQHIYQIKEPNMPGQLGHLEARALVPMDVFGSVFPISW